MYFDPLYLLFAIPGLILSMLASFYVKSTFSKYSTVRTRSGLTGAQAAAQMLNSAGIRNVSIERTGGFLSDHYDPSAKVLRLSADVYNSQSISAIGVACHEAGHAIQDADHYGFMWLRSVLFLPASIGSNFSYIIIIAGALLQAPTLINIGLILFSAAVLFTIVTLPVEWDASARAKKAILDAGFVTPAEHEHACSVLNAAFMTYIAAAVSALMTLLYYLVKLGIIGGRRSD